MAGKKSTSRSKSKRTTSRESNPPAHRRTTAARRSNPKKVKLFGLDAKTVAVDMVAIAGGGMLSAFAEEGFDRYVVPMIGADPLLANGAKAVGAAAIVVGAAAMEKKFKGVPIRTASIAFAGGIAKGLTEELIGSTTATEAAETAPTTAAGYGDYDDLYDLDDDDDYAVAGTSPNTDASHMLGYVADDTSHMASMLSPFESAPLIN